jgi:peptide/nickel transport system substrate-binding protein
MLKRRTFNAGLLAASALPLPAIAQGGVGEGKRGGDVVVAQQAQPPTLDAQTTTAQASRNITLHIWESLFTRDEKSNPQPDLAEGVDIAADGLTYRFPLRTGVRFHNGKIMTSADVKASMERYARVGGSADVLKPVAAVEAPDSKTVVLKLGAVFPGLIEAISSPRAPFVVMPQEECAKPAGQAGMIGTGPFGFAEYRPDSHCKLSRFDGYVANPNYHGRDGFAGRKTAYFDSVTFRFMPEGGARTAGLQTGELQVLESLDVAAAKRLKDDRNVRSYQMLPWAFMTLMMNTSYGLTAKLEIRRAMQSALDLEEIMAIATDGLYNMDPAWQYPATNYYPGTDGLARFTTQDQARARDYLKQAGYAGEELRIVTDNSFKAHLDAATIASEQLRAIGMKVNLAVMDWPTVMATRSKPEGWNMWPLMMGIEPYEGPYNVVGFFAGKQTVQIRQDPVIEDAALKLSTQLKLDERRAAVKQFQDRLYDQAIAVKVGDVGIYQATRANVVNYAPYRIPRMWDCWFA